MQGVLLVYSSNRNLPPEFVDSLQASIFAGAGVSKWEGASDVTLARNISLSKACEVLLQHPRFEVVLMVDDDMVWKVEQAKQLTEHCRNTKRPCSGCYVMKDGRMAAHHDGKMWQVGLGFVAIPRQLLLDLYVTSRRFTGANGDPVREFTRSGVEGEWKGEWKGEDFWLTRRMGGVDLLPIGVGHIKPLVLYPQPETLAAFIAKHSVPSPKG